jgi:hypothetical protein
MQTGEASQYQARQTGKHESHGESKPGKAARRGKASKAGRHAGVASRGQDRQITQGSSRNGAKPGQVSKGGKPREARQSGEARGEKRRWLVGRQVREARGRPTKHVGRQAGGGEARPDKTGRQAR